MYFLQKYIPFTKLLYRQLSAAGAFSLFEKEETEEPAAAAYDSDEYIAVLDRFIGTAADTAENNGVKLIIFYHPHAEFDDAGGLVMQTDEDAFSAFQYARWQGAYQ